jgi:hypothetical protein
VKGKGIGQMENNLTWHHKNKIAKDEVQALLSDLEAE